MSANEKGSYNASTGFDPNSIPKPTNYEIEKPYRGAKGFMGSYGLKWGKIESFEERKVILDGLRESIWQDRVNEARGQYECEQAAGKK